MKIVVNFMPEARQELLTLLEGRLPSAQAAVEFGHVCVADLQQQFVHYEGLLPDARKTRARDGSIVWWWQWTNGVWVVYHLSDVRGWFGNVTRTVTVVQFAAALPAA